MSQTSSSPDGQNLRWYQGLDRYCWVVLIIAALGWLFDTMDQNIWNLVRRPSLISLLRDEHPKWKVEEFAVQPADLRNAGMVVEQIGAGAGVAGSPPPAVTFLRTRLSPETLRLVEAQAAAGKGAAVPDTLKKALAEDLNRVVQGPPIWEPGRFEGLKLRPETQQLAQDGQGENVIRANRLLLEDTFAGLNKVLDKRVGKVGGDITTIFLLGWSVGGFIFGILGDKIGRTGTMILTILIYAIFTGLSGAPFVQSWDTYALMRFLTAVGVGGEWAAGASLVAEVFPARSRPMALGLLQALSAVGNMTAAVITMNLGDLQANWRIAYFIGALPALLVLWIRRSVKEPEAWHQAKSVGQELGNIAELFTHPVIRRHTLAAMLMATAGVGAVWGVGFFSTDFLRQELTGAGMGAQADRLVSIMFLLQNAGAFFGVYLFAAVSEKLNRKSAFYLWFALAWAAILIFFWGLAGSGAAAFTRAIFLAPILGFCTLGPFSGYTVYFPELFPTRLRATGCGFCYNAARVLAAAAPYALGSLVASLGGYAPAASVVSFVIILGFIGTALGPETKGKPLPD